jgi:hypothetical protein
MNEEEWRTAVDAEAMLDWARQRLSARQLRLFGVACCRRVLELVPDLRCDNAVDTIESFVEGIATAADCEKISDAVFEISLHQEAGQDGHVRSSVAFACADLADLSEDGGCQVAGATLYALTTLAGYPPLPQNRAARQEVRAGERHFQVRLLRDIFGNPFRPVVADPAWRTETVVGIARGIYDDRAFERLPILADALEEAGCDSAELLAHCREPGTHVRGCWAVDLVLGKE